MRAFKKILVHTDSRLDAHPALECAVELAKPHEARVAVVDVIPDFNWPARLLLSNAERIVEQLTQAKAKRLQELCDQVKQQGIDATTILFDGPTSVSLIREAMRGGYDLVIKEAKGHGSRRSGFLGTTATRLLRKCPCPVLILRPGNELSRRRVVAAVDATSEDETHAKLNERILEIAQPFCGGGRQLNVVHAWSVYGESLLREHMHEDEFEAVRQKAKTHAERKLDDLVIKFGMRIGDDHVRVLHGDAAERIPKFVNENATDLLAMGTVGRSGVAGLLMGNTAERILEKVECSILAVKPEGFASPIRQEL